MCFGSLGDDRQNLLDDLLLDDLGVQHRPAVEGHCDPELPLAVDPVATLRTKVFEGRE
jgi:hypothetical protein